MQIEGHAAIVAGGASGLGEAHLARAGRARRDVRIADLNEEKGAALAEELGPNATFVPCDVTDEAQVGRRGRASRAPGELRIGICCAGIGWAERTVSKRGPHQLMPFETVIRVNLIGTFNALRFAAAAINENEPLESGERGVCVNTASIAAFDGQIGQIAYSASKGGIVGMTIAAARDLRVVASASSRSRPAPSTHRCSRRSRRNRETSWAGRSHSPKGSAARKSSPPWQSTSSRTRC